MPSLRDLEAVLVRHYTRSPTDAERALNPDMPADRVIHGSEVVASLGEAQGVRFLCPKCFAARGGARGAHSIQVWFRGSPVPPDVWGGARWDPSGTGLDDLVLTPSIQVIGGCEWHGFVGSASVPPGHAA